MLHRRTLPVVFAGLVLALVLAGCGSASTGSSGSVVGASAPAASGTVIKTETVTLSGASKTALADAQGRTLYFFDKDSATTVACTGSCASNWPPLTGKPAPQASLPGTLGSLSGANGTQVLYNGHPLYTFAGDTGADQTHGDGVKGIWHVATTDTPVQAAPAANNNGY